MVSRNICSLTPILSNRDSEVIVSSLACTPTTKLAHPVVETHTRGVELLLYIARSSVLTSSGIILSPASAAVAKPSRPSVDEATRDDDLLSWLWRRARGTICEHRENELAPVNAEDKCNKAEASHIRLQ